MSNFVEQAAIMAAPPNAPSQQPAATNDTASWFSLSKIPNLLFMGGVMYAGGKLVEMGWEYVFGSSTANPPDEEEEDEEEDEEPDEEEEDEEEEDEEEEEEDEEPEED